MTLNEYVVLHLPARSGLKEKGIGQGLEPLGPDTGGQILFEPEISTAKLSKNDISDLEEDREKEFAPLMPTALHFPKKVQNIEAAFSQELAWGVRAVGAHTSPYTGKGIKVAVLDTGIDDKHPAFQGMNLLQKDFTGEGNGDKNGHGTHVAGTIFGQEVEGFRMGVAPGIDQAFIGKVLKANGKGNTKYISEGIWWAIQNGANVVCLSLGIDFPRMRERLVRDGTPKEVATSIALERYRENINLFNHIGQIPEDYESIYQPTILLAAAGNESRKDINPDHEIAAAPPAAAKGIMAVGALGQSPEGLVPAPFSNTKVFLSAPGVEIVSARTGGGLRKMDGTSMATPHVAGVAALWGEWLKKEQGSFLGGDLLSALNFNADRESLKKPYDRLHVGKGLVKAPPD